MIPRVSALRDDAGELPARIGPYRVEGVLGHGGMGVVYRAWGPEGLVALKVLQSDPRRASELRQRFEQEGRLRIEHPNVVRTVGSGVDEGRAWIAFELLEGRSLAAILCARGRLGIGEARSLALQAADGLAAAHAAGVVHRDLKPGNLVVEEDGTLRLVDFGIARITERDTRMTATGHLVGTAAYLSPEQARGDADVGPASDVWSLGVVLYEVLTGRNPFERGTLMPTMLAVLAEEPPPVTALRPEVPPSLSRLVARCLERGLDRRFPDAAALLEALREIEPDEVGAAASGATALAQPIPASALPPGEQRVVAVVLADGVVDPAAVASAIEDAGGVVIPLGDRALGLFGSTTWEGDEMDRAAAAGLAVRAHASAVGVASGRASYSGATGITGSVLVAAEEGCGAGLEGVALDEATARGLGGRWIVRAREGGGELEGEHERDTGTGRTLAPKARVTVGREAELAQLRSAVRAWHENECAVAALVVGPPGSGKTHLRAELARILERESASDTLILAAHAEPLQREVAFAHFRELLRSRAALGHEREGWPSLDASASLAERRGAVERLAAEADAPPGFMGALLSVPMDQGAERSDGRPTPAAVRRCRDAVTPRSDQSDHEGELEAAENDPRLMADRLRLTLVDWLSALADARPLVILADDLQWADDASLDLLEELAVQLSDAPMFVLLSARPELEERRPHLLAGVIGARIEPRPLLPSEVQELASALAGRPISPSLARRLAERTGGNPLFVEHIVRALGASGEESEEALPLPVTVEAAVQSRLDHLPSAEKELLKRAAIFERAFSIDELDPLGLFEPGPLLEGLTRRELLTARGRSRGIRRYQFRSVLVRDVAREMLGPSLREELHARLASHLAASRDADAEEVALHFERAQRPREAAAWYRRAVKAAIRRGDPAAVLASSERALALGRDEGGRGELHLARSEAFEVRGLLDAQSAELEAAERHAETKLERVRVAIDRAVSLWRAGKAEEALALARDGVETARRSEDPELLALALGRFAMIRTYAGALDEAEAALAEAEPLARAASPLLSAHAASWRAQLANARGDQGERRRAYRDAVRLYEEIGDVRRAAGAELNLADAANRVGAYAEAERALRATVEKCARVGNALWHGYAQLNLGYAALQLGKQDDAQAALDEAAATAERTGEARLTIFARLYGARALLARDPDRAAEVATLAAGEATEGQLPSVRVLALAIAGEAHLAAGRVEEALASSEEALSLRDELGAIEEDEAEVFLIRARALEAAGRFLEGEDVRARGRARIRELAERIADEALRARFLEDVRANREL